MKHFSHPHLLQVSEVKQDDQILCSVCEQSLFGPAQTCTKPNCNFFLHDSCFRLPRQIQHKSHPDHPLTVLPYPEYPTGQFTCDACCHPGTNFAFHCSACEFDLHVHCSSLPETINREDHQHPLTLLHPAGQHQRAQGITYICDVCSKPVHKSLYSCPGCKFFTHLECATDKAQAQPAAPVRDQYSVLAAQQRRLQAARYQAEMICDSSRAVANLAGSEPYYYVRRYY